MHCYSKWWYTCKDLEFATFFTAQDKHLTFSFCWVSCSVWTVPLQGNYPFHDKIKNSIISLCRGLFPLICLSWFSWTQEFQNTRQNHRSRSKANELVWKKLWNKAILVRLKLHTDILLFSRPNFGFASLLSRVLFSLRCMSKIRLEHHSYEKRLQEKGLLSLETEGSIRTL